MDAKKIFLDSLSDEQLGFFYANEFNSNLEDQLQDHLNLRQYNLFLQWKKEEATANELQMNKLHSLESLLEKLTIRLNKMEERNEHPITMVQGSLESSSIRPASNSLDEFQSLIETVTNRLDKIEDRLQSEKSSMRPILDKLTEVTDRLNGMDEKVVMSAKTMEVTGQMNTGGVIFCAGGKDSSGRPSRVVQVYDSKNNNWTKACEMTKKRCYLGLVKAHEKIYAIGGDVLSSSEVFTPSTGVWHTIASMKVPATAFGAVYAEGSIYCIGGSDGKSSLRKVEKYDINQNLWTQLPNMNVGRGGVGCAVLEGYVYAVGGHDDSTLSSCERYNLRYNSYNIWETVAPMNQERTGMGVCVLDGFIYAVGGLDNNSSTILTSVERYDSQTDKWTRVADLNTPRRRPAVAVMNGMLYAIGGRHGGGYLRSVEAYSPAFNKWTPVADLKEACFAAGAASIDCSIDVVLA